MRALTQQLRLLVLLLTSLQAFATTYIVSAPHLTMHVGDQLPPLLYRISGYTGSYSSHFSGEPNRTTTASRYSKVGEYPIIVSAGSLKLLSPGDQVSFVPGSIAVLPQDRVGAHLREHIGYPPGLFSGPGSAIVDVTRNSIANLVGDGHTDNADAFDKLVTQNGTRNAATTTNAPPLVLYFPSGVYATSKPLTIFGKFWTFYGSGPQSSVIKLLPNSPAFNVGQTPVQFFSPQSIHGNENFHNYIYNLGIEIGPGNPNAIPFTSEQNNSGAERNMQIWADDSVCPYAINFRRAYPGPLLLKDVAVYGCASAISSNQGEFSVTAENLTTEAQTGPVIDDQGLKLSIRHWLSDNSSSALRATGSATNVALLDSSLLGGDVKMPSVSVGGGGSLFLKNIAVSGYGPAQVPSRLFPWVPRNGHIEQAWTGTPQSVFDKAEDADTLHLPENETPEPSDPEVDSWTKLSQDTKTWAAAITGSRSSTVYTPPGEYAAGGTIQITVPGTVNHLQFFQAKFTTGRPQLILRVADDSKVPLVIDGCPYEGCQIVHTGSRTLVLRDSTLYSYTAQQGAGDFYIEDSVLSEGARGTLPVNFFSSQHIWARQLNLEQPGVEKFNCSGCTIWILGYKTEQSTPSIVLSKHAKAEVFGFFFYQNAGPKKPDSASIEMQDSSLFATGWTKVDVPGRGQPNWVNETANGKTSSLASRDVNTSQHLDMYFSHVAGKDVSSGKGNSQR